jgi:hypothetical protein
MSLVLHPIAFTRNRFTRARGLSLQHPVPSGASDVLARVVAMPISTWTYGFDDPSVKHLGPMAQDFAASFGLGSSDKVIHPVDGIGVALASIQALHRRITDLEAEVARLRSVTGQSMTVEQFMD